MADPDLGEALAAHARGDSGQARAILDRLATTRPGDFRVWHVAGELAAREGRLDEACERLFRAAGLAPRAGEVHHSLAHARWRAGLAAQARESTREARALSPRFVPAAVLQAIQAAFDGDAEVARRALQEAGAGDVANFPVRDLVVKLVGVEANEGRPGFARWSQAGASAPDLAFTVVTCSIDEAKLARAQDSLRSSDARPVQWIVIRDARSLAEAYNRAIDNATGEAILFLHDDVEILSPRLFDGLARALAVADVAGVAGTRRLDGPTVGWAGQEHAAGALAHGPASGGHYDYSVLNWADGVVPGQQALDGCFLAARTQAARAVRFDAHTFDAFHFYDLDFCLRATRAGARVAVTADPLVAHASRGSLAGPWEAQAARFLAKFPELAGRPARQNHFYAVRFATADRVRAMHAEMRGLASLLAAAGGRSGS